MTISTTTIKNSYSGNGSTTAFNYTFKIAASSEMQVIIRSSSGTETVKTLTTHYTISGIGNSGGGAVTFQSGHIPASGETVLLRRVTAQTQAMDLIDNDPMSADTIETAHDKSIALIQELQEQLDRSIKVSRTATITTPEITDDASARAGKLLGFDSTGNALDATIDGSGVAVSATNAANSATAAANSATASASSATAAQTAQAAAEAALDTFDDDFLGAKSSNPSVDNDGNALTDGALYFDTTNNVMKVYDLGNTQWLQLTPTSSQQTNINAAVSNATNINNVAGQIAPTNNIGTLAGLNTEIAGLYGIRTDISAVGGITAAVSAVNSNSANINAVNSNSTNINTLAGITNLGNLANAHAAVTNVNNNLASVQNFADVYRIASSAPTSSLNVGDLYFDTTANELKVYKSSGWAAAGSSVNGTSARFKFTASAGQTTFSGNDDNSNNLAFDASFIDCYLNGVRLVNGVDCTVSSGNSIVLASGAQLNDTLEAVAFGVFNLASIAATDLTDVSTGGVQDGQVLVYSSSNSRFQPGNASSAEVYGFNLSFVASTINYTVDVQSHGGSNKYFILGYPQRTLELEEGNTYVFTYPSGHPFALSTTSNGTHGGGSEYTTGVTRNSGANTLTYVVPTGAPTLYYYCTSHSNMGGQANTPAPLDNNLQLTTTNQGQDNISNAQYAAFDDVLFSASGFSFSLSNGSLIATI
ncbi:tail fiber [uncultured Mediterranean phage uvMED]|nr:tail fiber [uncultured Mediterranean phage uvMED]